MVAGRQITVHTHFPTDGQFKSPFNLTPVHFNHLNCERKTQGEHGKNTQLHAERPSSCEATVLTNPLCIPLILLLAENLGEVLK